MSISKQIDGLFEEQALDLEHYFPHYLSTISNRWMSTSSRLYLSRFGIGIVEWRVLGMLGSLDQSGSSTSLEIAKALSIDPGAVSRAMRNLVAKGMVEPLQGKFLGNTKPFTMTSNGRDLFRQVRAVALEREALLLQDLNDGERSQLIALLQKVFNRLDDLGEK